jgi:hypothetical protein
MADNTSRDDNVAPIKKTDNANSRGIRKNPLGEYSSYTYQISLYMISSSALNAYWAAYKSGTRYRINTIEGIYLVAQSGGINNNSERRAITLSSTIGTSNTENNRGYDYYIDNLSVTQLMPTKTGVDSEASETEFEFKIVEPYGFNFLPALKRAAWQIQGSESKSEQDAKMPIEIQQKYIIGVRFTGYDADGNMLKTSDSAVASKDKTSGITDRYSVFERFFPVEITDFTFKLDGRATVYNIKAIGQAGRIGFGQKNNTLRSDITVEGSTVEEVLNNLAAAVNKFQLRDVELKQRTIANEYSINLTKIPDIAASGFVPDKNRVPMSDTSEGVSTPGLPANQNTMQINRTSFSFSSGKALSQCITNVIANSLYIQNSINQVNNSDAETQSKSTAGGSTKKEFIWFAVKPEVESKGRDKHTGTDAHKIVYKLLPFKTPYLRTGMVKKPDYYGPVKRYDYWFSGLNTEIKNLEFTYNNLYYNSEPSNYDSGTVSDPSKTSAPRQPDNKQTPYGAGGGQNRASEVNQYLTAQIYNTVDNNDFSFSVLGDPDFLFSTLVNPENEDIVPREGVMGEDGTINPMYGQIFVEITFNTAVDYNIPDNSGLLKLADKTNFYSQSMLSKFAQDRSKGNAVPEGIIFELIECVSTFNNGSFEQNLKGILIDENMMNFGNTPVDQQRYTEQVFKNNSVDGIINKVRDDVSKYLGVNTIWSGIAPQTIKQTGSKLSILSTNDDNTATFKTSGGPLTKPQGRE